MRFWYVVGSYFGLSCLWFGASKVCSVMMMFDSICSAPHFFAFLVLMMIFSIYIVHIFIFDILIWDVMMCFEV